ncbi:hypothetical protein CISG_00877 [Coccidioides immitis RMSCC 3703]|uniref:Uncharacterized protein n=1 Tax=Coccidioides immitis RMSCC 3703 TaxID=454286 RepID=A0A0J8QQR3_COCIT|nr:hypothetical protein CISG_00877 [Coccidioides immitis RMSCC 3703]
MRRWSGWEYIVGEKRDWRFSGGIVILQETDTSGSMFCMVRWANHIRMLVSGSQEEKRGRGSNARRVKYAVWIRRIMGSSLHRRTEADFPALSKTGDFSPRLPARRDGESGVHYGVFPVSRASL